MRMLDKSLLDCMTSIESVVAKNFIPFVILCVCVCVRIDVFPYGSSYT